jgi:hypothetical protein
MPNRRRLSTNRSACDRENCGASSKDMTPLAPLKSGFPCVPVLILEPGNHLLLAETVYGPASPTGAWRKPAVRACARARRGWRTRTAACACRAGR